MYITIFISILSTSCDARSPRQTWPEQQRMQTVRQYLNSFQAIGISDEPIIAFALLFLRGERIRDELGAMTIAECHFFRMSAGRVL